MYRSTWIGLAASTHHHHVHGYTPLWYNLIELGVLIAVIVAFVWTMRR